LAARQKILSDWRLAVALAACFWGAILTLVVESLSLMHWLTRAGLLVSWAVVDLTLLLGLYQFSGRKGSRMWQSVWTSFQRARSAVDRLTRFAKWCWAGTVLIGAFLFGIAATTPTTNWDSMSYHLPRALHWIQQQSVEHFPTENTRQIEFGPWA